MRYISSAVKGDPIMKYIVYNNRGKVQKIRFDNLEDAIADAQRRANRYGMTYLVLEIGDGAKSPSIEVWPTN